MSDTVTVNTIAAPWMPTSIQETGLSAKCLSALVLKSLYVLGLETNIELARHLKLNETVVDQLMTGLKQQGFVEVLGAQAANVPILRYGLSRTGKELAVECGRQ